MRLTLDNESLLTGIMLALLMGIVAIATTARGDEPDRIELLWGTPTPVEVFEPGYVAGHVGHSGAEWTLEYIDAKKLSKAVVKRDGFPFFEDPDCPVEWRTTLKDYRGSGFDRGHQSSASDNRFSRAAMKSCFSLANMFPQTAKLNRGPWRLLEEHVRDVAKEPEAEVWVHTVGLFVPDEDGVIHIRTIGESQTRVPTHCAKTMLVRYGDKLEMKAWRLPNTEEPQAFDESEVTTDSIEHDAALNFWPAMTDEIEDALEAGAM